MGLLLDENTIMNLASSKPGIVEEVLFQVRDRLKRMSIGSGGSGGGGGSRNAVTAAAGKSSVRASNQSLFTDNMTPFPMNTTHNYSYPNSVAQMPLQFSHQHHHQHQQQQTQFLPNLHPQISDNMQQPQQKPRSSQLQQPQQQKFRQIVADDDHGAVSVLSAKIQEKDGVINDLKETVEILQLKIQKLEQLLQLKDRKIEELSTGAGRSRVK
jgi:hypothetical protein